MRHLERRCLGRRNGVGYIFGMSRFLLLLWLSCISSSACQRLPRITDPTGDATFAGSDFNTVVIPIAYTRWFSSSIAVLVVNEKHVTVSASNISLTIARPADGNVVISTSNPHGLTCVAPQAPIKVDDAQQGVTISCTAILQFSNGQAADQVIGQPGMNTNTLSSSPSATVLYQPWGLATEKQDNPNWLFVADELFNRILAYHLPIEISQPPADMVLGQGGSFTGSADAVSQSTMSQPLNLDTGGGAMIVADGNNNRVLIYHSIPTDFTAKPETVVGQPSFATVTAGCDANSLHLPFSGLIAGNRLYVADTKNHRVLMWLSVPQDSVAPPADGVIGQTTFTGCAQTSPPGANTLAQPRTLHWDGNYFFLGDSGNNRILVYQGLPDASSTPTYLIGQPSFDSNQPAGTDTGLNLPKGITSDANTLFVSDTYNCRVLGYARSAIAGSTIGSPPHAYVALGQSSPSAFSAPDSTPPSSVTINQPAGLVIVGSQLFVSDTYNQRVLVFGSL